MEKAKKVFTRLGFEDVIIAKEVYDHLDFKLTGYKPNSFLVGYEDKDGVECFEDGTYINPGNILNKP
jgi:hypothetical protein